MKETRKKMEKFIKENATKELTLDIGCKDRKYKKYFPNSVGVDVQKGKDIDIVADAQNLPFANECFDAILCTEVLEHIENPHQAISEMKRVLTKNGKLILTTRFIFPIHDEPTDYFRFTCFGLEKMLHGFNNVSIKKETSIFGTIFIIFQRLSYKFIHLQWNDIENSMTSGYYVEATKI